MKTLYLECNMGAAGDMLAAALLEQHPAPEEVIARLNRMGLHGVEFSLEPAVKCGITGSHFTVRVHGVEEAGMDDGHGHEHGEHDHDGHDHAHGDHDHDGRGDHAHRDHDHDGHDHEHGGHDHGDRDHGGHDHEHGDHAHGHHHAHHSLHDIEHILSHLEIPQTVREDAAAVYRLIAEAESQVHGRPVEQIHFHEVGTLDAVADVTAVCLLLHELSPDRIVASPVHVGCGQVRCAHGVLPVPAPATEWLLKDIPSYGGNVRGELCTPTGAALLRHFVQEFGPRPMMRVQKIGYGMGKKDFEQANCVRAILGEEQGQRDSVVELRCNLDDMTPEAIGFAMERLLDAGALDVYTTPIGMKKNRPGVLLSCMCRMEQREEMVRLLFQHTATLGIREEVCSRYTLERTIDTVESQYGSVRVKQVSGWGVDRKKAEYEDLARIAREQGISLSQAASFFKF
ncbi:MAG: nickel pincer cofactor biosynthesis protein LarC [Candidatus Gastranaerophilales bacterium]|nr:nickel pincer cofactor biosynthesis protein LarC [Candidatus Gastranaerophilales bacterium]